MDSNPSVNDDRARNRTALLVLGVLLAGIAIVVVMGPTCSKWNQEALKRGRQQRARERAPKLLEQQAKEVEEQRKKQLWLASPEGQAEMKRRQEEEESTREVHRYLEQGLRSRQERIHREQIKALVDELER